MSSARARSLLAAWDNGAVLDPAAFQLTDPDAGLALQNEVNALRRARGERELGMKIGFTNRSIWPIYGVNQPIWAPVWDSTVTQLTQPLTRVTCARYSLPRLEPEIVLELDRSPDSAEPGHVFECIGWIAHGVEIVCSPWPEWRLDAAQATAALGLHGALHIGPRQPRSIVSTPAQLSELQLDLFCDGKPVAQGLGSAVLDGPVQALAHLVGQLLSRGIRLPPHSVITTGTLTCVRGSAGKPACRASICQDWSC